MQLQTKTLVPIWEFPKIRSTLFGGLYDKDLYPGYYIWVPYFWKLPYRVYGLEFWVIQGA